MGNLFMFWVSDVSVRVGLWMEFTDGVCLFMVFMGLRISGFLEDELFVGMHRTTMSEN